MTAIRRGRGIPAGFLVALSPITTACGGSDPDVLTFSASAVGTEAEVLRRQLARFTVETGLEVEIRVTPDAADQRHQLYVQWLNARAEQPDVLQLDVIWTPEFAAAGWILPLGTFSPDVSDFFAATLAANSWRGDLYALPWFADVGMLYWRTDLLGSAPATIDELASAAAGRPADVPYGFVWQGARYEGLVTVFLEVLGAFGGEILDAEGAVVVDSGAGVSALTALLDFLGPSGVSPRAVLSWQEEQTRFAFQNGQALFMRNWPYASALLSDAAASDVAGRFAVAPMPGAPGGRATAALGGSQLAINAFSRRPEDAYALVTYLLEPARMLERARAVGQYPTRRSLYEAADLENVLGVPAEQARELIERAVPRPVTPVYTELSRILQVELHRALTGQREPDRALADAAVGMRALLDRAGLTPGGREGASRDSGRGGRGDATVTPAAEGRDGDARR